MCYFDKKHTGGKHGSIGYSYQDHGCLLFFINHFSAKGFQSISVETFDDFVIHYSDKNYEVQAKSTKIGIPQIKEHLDNKEVDDKNELVFVADSFTKEGVQLVDLLEDYHNASKIGGAHNKDKIKKDFTDQLTGLGLGKYVNKLMSTHIYQLPQKNQHNIVYGALTFFLDTHNYACETELLFNSLLLHIGNCRKARKNITKGFFTRQLEKYSKVQEDFDEKIPFPRNQWMEKFCEPLQEKFAEEQAQAKKFLKNKEYEKAREIYDKVAQADIVGYKHCACACMAEGSYRQAVDYINKFLSKSFQESEHYPALIVRAQMEYFLGDMESAYKTLLSANEIQPGALVYYNLGVLCMEKLEKEKSIHWFKKCFALDATHADACLNLGILSQGFQKINWLDKAISLNPFLGNAYAEKGNHLLDIGMYKQAEKHLRKALELNYYEENVYVSLAITLFFLGERSEAAYYMVEAMKRWRPTEKNIVFTFLGLENFATPGVSKSDNGFYEVSFVNNERMLVQTGGEKDTISLGGIVIEDSPELLIPVVMREYKDYDSYQEIISLIQEKVQLLEMPSEYFADQEEEIEVHLIDKTNYLLVSIVFGDFSIRGRIDTFGEGYRAFMRGFQSFEYIEVLLQCGEEKFCITNVKSLTFHTTFASKYSNYTGDITEKNYRR